MKKLLLIPFFILLGLGAYFLTPVKLSNPTSVYNEKLKINNETLHVQRVTSKEDWAQGLSGRDSLEESQGMLFDFGSTKNIPNFWMKDMKFDLDIVWIDENKIVGVEKNVPAPKSSTDPLPHYSPTVPINKVLEVNAGWFDRHKIKIGDIMKIDPL